QNKAAKTTEELAIQILLLFQVGPLTGIGAVANLTLFILNFSPILVGSQLRSIQVILTNMTLANFLILFTTWFPNKMVVFGLRRPMSNVKCKLEYYVRLVAQSTNLCSMCVLSIYQFLTLVPGNWGRVMLRGSAQGTVGYSCCGCWLFSLLNNIYIPMKVTDPQNTLNGTDSKSKWVCPTSTFNMIWTSVSMVILLHRHQQRLQHIHTSIQDHRGHPETRATHIILILVVTFVTFYVLDCVYTIFNISFVDAHLWLRHVKKVLAASFSTISPLMLIIKDLRSPRSCHSEL
uniref:Vomeronasal type-1 receptor n=1 Tax=Nannospalax galili TaxID=1026970 RepID=A0A8C6RH10_NANGA